MQVDVLTTADAFAQPAAKLTVSRGAAADSCKGPK